MCLLVGRIQGFEEKRVRRNGGAPFDIALRPPVLREGQHRRSIMMLRILIRFSGGYCGGVTPDPIPNSEVKPSSADGTAGETLWESRSLPDLWAGSPLRDFRPFFYGRIPPGARLLSVVLGEPKPPQADGSVPALEPDVPATARSAERTSSPACVPTCVHAGGVGRA